MPKPKCRYFNKPCLEHNCIHYVQLHGKDPQTGEPLSSWMCLDLALLKVALEGNKELRDSAASTDSMRNVVAAKLSSLDGRVLRRMPQIGTYDETSSY